MASSRPPSSGKTIFPDVPENDCPYVKRPLPDCYCRNLTNSTIPLVIYFCRERYVECPIYRSKHDDSP
jgi:hypothetical protein